MCKSRLQLADDLFHFPGQCPTVGIAKDDRFRATAHCGSQRFERVGGVRFVAVKEMFSVVDHALPVGFEVRHRLLDDAQIIL